MSWSWTVSYRQNTELHVEAWHWNPQGTWSDPARRGYFTGSASPGEPIRHSYGYPLPHRGVTRNDGTDNIGYSRLTDGDPDTYWKSNPVPDARRSPARMMRSTRNGSRSISRARSRSTPSASPGRSRSRAAIWCSTGRATESDQAADEGAWRDVPGWRRRATAGAGRRRLLLSPSPLAVRFLRIWMTESSNTCDTHGSRIGATASAMRSASSTWVHSQPTASSTIWSGTPPTRIRRRPSLLDRSVARGSRHRSEDREQVGLDLFYTSGYTRGLPAMIPIAMLYGTPEDAAAQIAYLKKRGYPISWIEMGEEPDGQFMLPEDYGALYLQFADGAAPRRSGAQAGRPGIRGGQRGHPGLAGRAAGRRHGWAASSTT